MVRQDSPHINASRTASSVGCFLHDDIKQTTSHCGEVAEHFDVYLQLDFSSTWTKHPEGSIWNVDGMNMEVPMIAKTLTECQKLCDDYSDGNVCKRFTFVPKEAAGAPVPTCILQIPSPKANAKFTYDVDAFVSGFEAYERASVTCASATTVPQTPSKSTCKTPLSTNSTPPSTPCFPETYNGASCKKPGVDESVTVTALTVTAPAGTSVSAAALYGLRVSVGPCARVWCARGGCSYTGPAANVVLPMP